MVKSDARSKPKKKSVKAKATGFGSARKLSRMGKRQAKGAKGIAANYITRSQILKRLQITLRDFRRLCILKGIYPRDPKKKASGKDKTYYHCKDISYLAHEPLLAKFRQFKAFMKKVRRAVGRKEIGEARRKDAAKPTYTLDHLVKERYPRFVDAVRDLDDALCLIHLFAALPAERRITADRTANCQRLCQQWQHYVAHARALTKTFISIKGIYFEAEVCSTPVTWLVPHQFTLMLPEEVDFRVMLTFLEFHETFVKFVLFKLYHSAGLSYPPVLESGSLGGAVVSTQPPAAVEPANAVPQPPVPSEARRRLKTLDGKLKQLEAEQSADEDGELSEDARAQLHSSLMASADDDDDDRDDGVTREAFPSGSAPPPVFEGARVFLAREAQHSWLAFAITGCGGHVGWEGEDSPFAASDERITHHVVDRPKLVRKSFSETMRLSRGCFVPDARLSQRDSPVASREYVQPQWIVDSINCRAMLPVERYAPGVTLPVRSCPAADVRGRFPSRRHDWPFAAPSQPHLSPFVDDNKEGYVPAYREELDRLASSTSSGARATMPPPISAAAEDAADEVDMEAAAEAQAALRESQVRMVPRRREDRQQHQPSACLSSLAQDNEEAGELAKIMMSKKARRLYDRMQHGLQEKRDANDRLKRKREEQEGA